MGQRTFESDPNLISCMPTDLSDSLGGLWAFLVNVYVQASSRMNMYWEKEIVANLSTVSHWFVRQITV